VFIEIIIGRGRYPDSKTLLKQLGAHLNSLDKLFLPDLAGHTWTCLLSTALRLLPLTKEWTFPVRIYAFVWISATSKEIALDTLLWTTHLNRGFAHVRH
jgi:hypothetical protein